MTQFHTVSVSHDVGRVLDCKSVTEYSRADEICRLSALYFSVELTQRIPVRRIGEISDVGRCVLLPVSNQLPRTHVYQTKRGNLSSESLLISQL